MFYCLTRQKHQFHAVLILYFLNIEKELLYKGSKLWNYLPADIQVTESL